MGFWRNVGYFWAGVMIVAGLILFPFGLISVGLGLFFIWLLKNSARQERIEKHLKHMDPYENDTEENSVFDKKRNVRYYKD